MGTDLDLVNSARVSYNKESTMNLDSSWEFLKDIDSRYLNWDAVFRDYGSLTKRDIGISNSLSANGHTSPSEQIEFRFRIECPISVAREIFRTRIAEYNEISARYTKMPNEFYLPLPEHVRRQTGKAMSYTFESVDSEKAERFIEELDNMYKIMYTFYERWTEEEGLAKELVRNVLPVGMMTKFIMKLNLHSLFNFLDLRSSDLNSDSGVTNASQALLEIRMVADEMEKLATPIAPIAFAGWRKRKAQWNEFLEWKKSQVNV